MKFSYQLSAISSQVQSTEGSSQSGSSSIDFFCRRSGQQFAASRQLRAESFFVQFRGRPIVRPAVNL